MPLAGYGYELSHGGVLREQAVWLIGTLGVGAILAGFLSTVGGRARWTTTVGVYDRDRGVRLPGPRAVRPPRRAAAPGPVLRPSAPGSLGADGPARVPAGAALAQLVADHDPLDLARCPPRSGRRGAPGRGARRGARACTRGRRRSAPPCRSRGPPSRCTPASRRSPSRGSPCGRRRRARPPSTRGRASTSRP